MFKFSRQNFTLLPFNSFYVFFSIWPTVATAANDGMKLSKANEPHLKNVFSNGRKKVGQVTVASHWLSGHLILSLSLSLSGRVTRFAKFGKSLQVFVKTSCQLISYLSNCWAYFGKMQHYWANWNCSKWPNIEKKSNHLVTLLSDNRARRPKTSDQLTFSVDPFLIDTLLPRKGS